jgi:hypothetical protein
MPEPVRESTAATGTPSLAPPQPVSESSIRLVPPAPAVTLLPPAQHAGQAPAGGSPLELQRPEPALPRAPMVYALDIASSVGTGSKNRTDDVRVVQRQLASLGFPVQVTGVFSKQTSQYLKIFASICSGMERWTTVSDRVTAKNDLARWLVHPGAPRWNAVPAQGPGFVRIDRDGYGWGTNWTMEAIAAAAGAYETKRLAAATAMPPIMINDVSRVAGDVLYRGKIPEHVTHRNGLDIDVRLPKKGGDGVPQTGTRVGWTDYDRDATYQVLCAFGALPDVSRFLLNDPVLKRRAQTEGKPWAKKLVIDRKHQDHVHFDIRPRDLKPIR